MQKGAEIKFSIISSRFTSIRKKMSLKNIFRDKKFETGQVVQSHQLTLFWYAVDYWSTLASFLENFNDSDCGF